MKLIAGFLFSKMNLAQERNIDLNINVKNSTLTSKAAEFELLDTMSILVDNAFDATEDGGHIEIVIDSDGTKTSVETLNAGPTHRGNAKGLLHQRLLDKAAEGWQIFKGNRSL